jgi:PAS domain S-box-containing protein
MFDLDLNIVQNVKPQDLGLIFKAIMQSSKDGLLVTDQNGNVVLVNRASEEMNAYNASDIIGKNVRDLVKDGYYNRSVAVQVLKRKKVISLIHSARTKRRILCTGVPIFDDVGKIKFVLVNGRDITELNRLREDLEKAEVMKDKYRSELFKLRTSTKELKNIVVRNPQTQKVVEMAIRAARFDSVVLLTGESGVGKSLIASLIHGLSARRKGPLIKVSCGAISEGLIESELFGYEKGAFTGAYPGGKQGLFEAAHKGALLLDEISEIPFHLQAKLLRFIEDKEVVRVGSVKPRKIDLKVMAATNRDLEKMVNRGKFRKDLYFRLNVIPIEIGPLKERKEDIPPLLSYFVKRLNRKLKTEKFFSEEAIDALVEYSFPGNVRELENLVERLITMTQGNIIELKDLPVNVLKSLSIKASPVKEEPLSYHQAVLEFETGLIKNAILQYGSQRNAARKLGIDQSTISKKLKIEKADLIAHKSLSLAR